MRYWTTPDRTRHFLIPADAYLPPGDLLLRTPGGQRLSVDADAAAAFETTESEARAWAREQALELAGSVRTRVLGFAERLRARTDALRDERRRAAGDWARRRGGPSDH
jgi:hypothetical protein